jgi:hypothetical protein
MGVVARLQVRRAGFAGQDQAGPGIERLVVGMESPEAQRDVGDRPQDEPLCPKADETGFPDLRIGGQHRQSMNQGAHGI